MLRREGRATALRPLSPQPPSLRVRGAESVALLSRADNSLTLPPACPAATDSMIRGPRKEIAGIELDEQLGRRVPARAS